MWKLTSSELAEVLPTDVDALQAIFPMFGRITAITPDPDASRTDAYELSRQSFRALRELFLKMAERYTVVVVLDDLQWGGSDTAALVGDVFRPPDSPRVLLVLVYRSEDDTHSTMLSELRKRAGILFDSIHHVVLGPLDRVESCELAMQLLGSADSSSRLAEHVAAEAGGHPLFIRELALALAVAASDGQCVHPAPGMTADLDVLLAERIADLPGTERAILEFASVASRPLLRRVLLSAVGEGGRAHSDVVKLARKRLLRETTMGGALAVEPLHSKVRDAVLASVSSDERRQRHKEDRAEKPADQAPPRWRIRAALASALVDTGRSRDAADASRARQKRRPWTIDLPLPTSSDAQPSSSCAAVTSTKESRCSTVYSRLRLSPTPRPKRPRSRPCWRCGPGWR